MSKHASDSSEQRAAEKYLIRSLGAKLGVALGPAVVDGFGKAHANLDGYSSEHRVLAEAYARHGKLKPAQVRKVASDALKLAFLEHSLGGEWRKFLCFADRDACASLQGESWLAHALRNFNIVVQVFPLPAKERANVIAAQQRQLMVNAPQVLTIRSSGPRSAAA